MGSFILETKEERFSDFISIVWIIGIVSCTSKETAAFSGKKYLFYF
jgi:hypothetical protein